MIEVQEFLYESGASPFREWFASLDARVAAKVNTYLTRIEGGNTSSIKSLKGGVHECRIDWGPGYRVYLGQDRPKLVILLGGGTKKKQQQDIEDAKELWALFKKQKKKR